MNQRAFSGVIVLATLIAALVYLWQPWDTSATGPINLGLDLRGGLRVMLQAEEATPDRDDLNAARRVIENRIDEFGVAEPLIQTSGDNRILVELPGLSTDDQERALDLIGQQAVLTFRLVRPQSAQLAAEQMTLNDLEEVAFTGEILRNAQAAFDQRPGGGNVVSFDIRREYAQEFGQFTGNNINRRMAIVLDETVISAPSIRSRISDSGQIDGMANIEEASDLALVLRSGSLPISLQVEEIRAIGPTLGRDAIAAGTTAAFIGGAAVVAAILLYYGPLFGGVLTVGLVFIMLLIFGALAGLGATLTLPGLAGLVLTIGAAVDGNVISFERIKEEIREGRSLRLAMKSGFKHSLSAIIDANVTTLLAAVTLYQYTTGPVRGFAVTLAIGILAAVFVNTVAVPFILDVLTLRVKRPLMPQGFHVSDWKFVGKAPVVMSLSALLAVGSIVFIGVTGLNLSTDFTGGTNALYRVPDGTGVNEVRSAIDELGIAGISGAGATIQEIDDATITAGTEDADVEAASGSLISVRAGVSEESEAASRFPGDLADTLGAELLQADFVGPAVGEDLRNAAVMAILVSLALILAYVGWRFWPNWIIAIAAILAVIHDVGITLGIMHLLGAEFSIPVLAAALFVVGYSLNDSIIISDRMRENLRKVRGVSFEKVIDLSVSQTLARTVMTSLTTLLPVLALLFFGGSVLRDFSMALLIGIAVGTYSSIFILAPMVVWFKNRQRSAIRTARRPVATRP